MAAATTTMATVAFTLVLLYVILNRRSSKDYSKRSAKLRMSRRPVAQAPATFFEKINTVSETFRFAYSETLGKWSIGDLPVVINYLIRSQGNLQVASVYTGEDSVRLKGADIIALLYHYVKLLTLCMLFSKKPFLFILDSAGYCQADVLLKKPKAGLLKPAFTIIRDKDSKCFLLLIRGAHSIKDTLTAATGSVVPFHHSVLHDGVICNLVVGYAHCGMVAAARWIAKLSTPILLKALQENRDYEVKIVGHSLGGGSAALLTYILREQKELSSITCVTFAPAACMTWELAESGKHFITTIINGSDIVPTLSTASVDDLRSEVRASAWLKDLCASGSRLLSVSKAKARVAGACAFRSAVSKSTRVSGPVLIGYMGRRRVGNTSSRDESAKEESDEEEGLFQFVAASTSEDITEKELWYEVENEVQRWKNDADIQAQEEEEAAAAAEEITEEKKVLAKAEESQTPISSSDVSENLRLYPPGKIMQIVSVPSSEATTDYGQGEHHHPAEKVSIYETPRGLYGKLRLSKTMINDHDSSMYKKMMERLIKELENEE